MIGLLKERTMNDEEINRAIAEHIGARFFTEDGGGFWVVVINGTQFSPFTEDLNAMHEAVQRLNEVELFRYADEVCDLAYDGHHDTDIQKLLNLSAKELAGRYVRAIGKWRGEE